MGGGALLRGHFYVFVKETSHRVLFCFSFYRPPHTNAKGARSGAGGRMSNGKTKKIKSETAIN